MDDLPDDELRRISLNKNRKGNATSTAMQAQRILHSRSGHWDSCRYERKGTANDGYGYGEPERFTKRFR